MRRYLRALSAFYIRLTFRSIEVYEILEPLMRDFRKLRVHHAGQSSHLITLSHLCVGPTTVPSILFLVDPFTDSYAMQAATPSPTLTNLSTTSSQMTGYATSSSRD